LLERRLLRVLLVRIYSTVSLVPAVQDILKILPSGGVKCMASLGIRARTVMQQDWQRF
jgi:hypothetical protein